MVVLFLVLIALAGMAALLINLIPIKPMTICFSQYGHCRN
jgi:hypothetical protein